MFCNILTGQSFSLPVIPFCHVVKRFTVKTRQLRGLLCASQGTYTHAGKPVRKCFAQTFSRRFCLLAPGVGKRNIGAARMLSAHAPRRLTVTQKNDSPSFAALLGLFFAICLFFAINIVHICYSTAFM